MSILLNSPIYSNQPFPLDKNNTKVSTKECYFIINSPKITLRSIKIHSSTVVILEFHNGHFSFMSAWFVNYSNVSILFKCVPSTYEVKIRLQKKFDLPERQQPTNRAHIIFAVSLNDVTLSRHLVLLKCCNQPTAQIKPKKFFYNSFLREIWLF